MSPSKGLALSRAFIFYPVATQPNTSVYGAFCELYRPRHKTAHRVLQGLFLRLHPLNRPRYQPDTSGYNTTCATLHRSAQPYIIIMYIKGQTMPAAAGRLLSCADRLQVLHPAHPLRDQPGGVSALPGIKTGPGRNRLDLAHVRRCAFSLARRAARNYWRLSPHLFSGFRPIANRGQQ